MLLLGLAIGCAGGLGTWLEGRGRCPRRPQLEAPASLTPSAGSVLQGKLSNSPQSVSLVSSFQKHLDGICQTFKAQKSLPISSTSKNLLNGSTQASVQRLKFCSGVFLSNKRWQTTRMSSTRRWLPKGGMSTPGSTMQPVKYVLSYEPTR